MGRAASASWLEADNLGPVGDTAITKERKRGPKGKAAWDAIVAAAAELLGERGYEGLTVQAIAARLGVSEGTPYQYFSNKAAVASAIIDLWSETFVENFERALANSGSNTLAQTANAIVEAYLRAQRNSIARQALVYEIAPRLGLIDRVKRVSQRSAELIETRLRCHSQEIHEEADLGAAAVSIEMQLSGLAIRSTLLPAEARRLVSSVATSIVAQLKTRA